MSTIIKIFIFLIFCVCSLEGSILIIDNNFITGNSSKVQFNIEDKNGTLKNDDIVLNDNFKQYTKNYASYTTSTFWSRFDIQNQGNKLISLILSNPRAGIDEIDVFIYKEKKLLHKYALGDLRPQSERSLLSPKSVFYISLEPNEIFTIVTRYKNLGSYDFNWEISSTLTYSYKNSFNLWFWGIFAGIMITLIFYNLIMYVHLKKTVFLLFVFTLFFYYGFNMHLMVFFTF